MQLMPRPPESHLSLVFSGGANNMASEYALPETHVRDALNMDVNPVGVRTRRGLRVLETWDCHSLFPHPAGGVLLVHDGYLWRVHGGNVTQLDAVAQDRRVRYAVHNAEVFWTNGLATGRITSDGSSSFWGLSAPPPPLLTTTTGNLPAGTYQATYTAVIDGVESGAPVHAAIELTESGGILLVTPTAASGVTFNAYLSTTNGGSGKLRRVLTDIPGGTSASLPLNRGVRLQSLLAVKPYPGNLLASYHGRLWVAAGSTLWFTDSASPHWLFPAEQYFLWPSRITMGIPVLDGLFVATEHATWMLQGDGPANMVIRQVADQGTIFGTGTNRVPYDIFGGDGTPCAVWLDTDGVLCCGRSGGVVQRMTENRYRIGNASSGDIIFRIHAGIRHLLVILDGPVAPVGVAQDVGITDYYDWT